MRWLLRHIRPDTDDPPVRRWWSGLNVSSLVQLLLCKATYSRIVSSRHDCEGIVVFLAAHSKSIITSATVVCRGVAAVWRKRRDGKAVA